MNELGLIIASMEFSIVAGEAMKRLYEKGWLDWIVDLRRIKLWNKTRISRN